MPIEKLKNCPNCGAILDDLGRCKFCGSKVYDLFDVDVTDNRGGTYIRIKTSNGVIVAPIRTHYVDVEFACDAYPTMTVNFVITGDIYYGRTD